MSNCIPWFFKDAITLPCIRIKAFLNIFSSTEALMLWLIILALNIIAWYPTQWTRDAIKTALLRQNDIAMSFWRNNDVTTASCVRRVGTK